MILIRAVALFAVAHSVAAFICRPSLMTRHHLTATSCKSTDDDLAKTDCSIGLDACRRGCLSSILALSTMLSISLGSPSISWADVDTSIDAYAPVILKGVVTLKAGTEFKPSSDDASAPSSAALYITAKPEQLTPMSAFDATITGGRPPPIMTAKFPMGAVGNANAFPFHFQLTSNDVTSEGAFGITTQIVDPSSFWWYSDNLIVSCRLDRDGVAATRDPEDLVGRSFSKVNKGTNNEGTVRGEVRIELQGRGIGGKFVTQKQVK